MPLIPMMILMTTLVLTPMLREHIRIRKLRRSYDNYHLQTFESVYDETLRQALRPQGYILC